MGQSETELNEILDIQVLTPYSIAVFITAKPAKLLKALDNYKQIFVDRQVAVLILNPDTTVAMVSDEELLSVGLKRVPRQDLQ